MLNKYTTIKLKFRNQQGKIVEGFVIVRDGSAMISIQQPAIIKQLYEAEKKCGRDVFYEGSRNIMVEHYKGKTKDEIVAKLTKEIKKMGGVSKIK